MWWFLICPPLEGQGEVMVCLIKKYGPRLSDEGRIVFAKICDK